MLSSTETHETFAQGHTHNWELEVKFAQIHSLCLWPLWWTLCLVLADGVLIVWPKQRLKCALRLGLPLPFCASSSLWGKCMAGSLLVAEVWGTHGRHPDPTHGLEPNLPRSTEPQPTHWPLKVRVHGYCYRPLHFRVICYNWPIAK